MFLQAFGRLGFCSGDEVTLECPRSGVITMSNTACKEKINCKRGMSCKLSFQLTKQARAHGHKAKVLKMFCVKRVAKGMNGEAFS